MLSLLVAGCINAYRLEDLESERPLLRMKAAAYFGSRKSEEAAPYLVQLLDDEEPSVRILASAALKEISGKDFGFNPVFKESEANFNALVKWRQWADSLNSKDENASK